VQGYEVLVLMVGAFAMGVTVAALVFALARWLGH